MATLSSQSWNVVGKSTKKTKQNPQVLKKDERKTFIEKMPRIEPNAPVKESSTIYDAFLAKSSSEKNTTSTSSKPKEVSKAAVTKKKKTDTNNDRKKEKSMTLEDAVNQIDHIDLESIITQSKASFPDNKDVWLKNLASYLNVKLEPVPESDPVFKNKPRDYPLCKLNAKCKDVLKNSLKNCNSETLEHLFYHCVQAMLTDMGNGLSTYGYRIFLQSMAWQNPSIVFNKTNQYLELLKANQNRPVKCLSILWALGLVGTKNLKAGLRAWLDLMLPMAGIRSLASYSVDYLDNLLQFHSEHKSAYGVMTIRDFFPILDMVFGNTLNLPSELNKKLQALYPKLKTIAFGADPKSTLRLFFPSFLSRATPDSRNSLRNEILPCLVYCLMTDKQCFSVWRQMYTKHLAQSSVLLRYLSENWPQMSRKLEKKLLYETIRTFSVTNDELLSQGHHAPEETGCHGLCKDLLLGMGQPTVFSWYWLVFLIIGLVLAIISYDIYTAKKYQLSRSWRFLEEYGILAVLRQVWVKVSTVTLQLLSWLQINVPIYYGQTCETVGPYLKEAQVKLIEWYGIVEVATRVHRQWLATKILEFCTWVYQLSPEFWGQAREWFYISIDFVREFFRTLGKLILDYSQIVYIWIIENVIREFSVEKMGHLMSSLLLSLQKLLTSFVQWCGALVTTMTK